MSVCTAVSVHAAPGQVVTCELEAHDPRVRPHQATVERTGVDGLVRPMVVDWNYDDGWAL